MRSKQVILGLVALALSVAGCGGSSSVSRSAAAPSTSSGARVSGHLRVYRVTLTGRGEVPRGAPAGTGSAIIAIHGGSVVCWRFAHLHGFSSATFAHIHVGRDGQAGSVVVALSTGPRLHHRGCARARPAVVKAIERDPAGYYVNIHSVQYPAGAVRAQL